MVRGSNPYASSTFLDDRPMHVSDDIWMKLSVQLFRTTRASRDQYTTQEMVSNDLIGQISEMINSRTGPADLAEVTAETIAIVRSLEVFSSVFCNFPEKLLKLD